MTATADETRLYVLPPEAPFLANLAALWATDPALAAAIERTESTSSYPAQPTRSPVPTASAPTADGRMIQLHSRYQPLEEAAKLVETVDLSAGSVYWVQGFGLGYHVQRLFELAGEQALFCVFEPDLVLLRTAFELRDYSTLIASRRVLWFWRDDKAEFFTRLTPHAAAVQLGFAGVRHAPSIQLHPEFFAQAQTWIEEFTAYARTTISTLVVNSRRTAENVADNLGWYVASDDVAWLKDVHAGQPAIIVSAGPSLRKNKHLLAEARGRAVIIAVQTTLQPLLEMGIEPHYVTSLDWSDISSRFWERLPRNLSTRLVAEPKAANRILQLNPGPLSLLGNDFAEQLLAEMKLNRGKLPSGATVAHLAYYLAEQLGCDPIIFIGQDLGFSDGLCYAPGTSYEDVWRPELSRFCTVEMKQWEQIVRDRPILRRVLDHEGRPTYTEERLFTYLQHFERDFARTHRRIIDATEGGLLKRGAVSMTLAEAIERHCTRAIEAGAVARGRQLADRTALVEQVRQCLANRASEAKRIEQIARQTLPLLEGIESRIEDQAHVNRSIARIDAIRASLEPLMPTYGLIMHLTQRSEFDRFQADRKIAAAKVEGFEKQRRQVMRDIENVKHVVQAARAFVELMQRADESAQAFAQGLSR
jgi:hypothetical protein